MKRPNRLDYPNGFYGDISFLKQLNKYCSHIESKNKSLQLLQSRVSKSVCNHCNNKLCDSQTFNQQCFKCGKKPL